MTGLTALGAGCTALPPLGSEIRYGTVDVPDADRPAYRDWLPAPSAFPDDSESADGYDVLVHVPPGDDAPAWARGSLPRTLVVDATDYVGFHVDDAEFVVGTDTAAVLVGDVDRGVVRETIARTSYEPAGADGDYDVYARPDRDRVVAVGPDALAFGFGAAPRASVATILNAGRGEVPRYHAVDDDAAALFDSAGMRRWAWHWPSGVGRATGNDVREDTVGWATTFDHRNGGAYFVETWVFPTDYDLTVGSVKGALKREGLFGSTDAVDVTAVDVSVTGRVATIGAYLAPDVVQDELADAAGPAPYVTWRAGFDAERLTIHHEAGDPVETAHLSVEAPDLTVDAAEAGDVGSHVEPGEALTVSTSALGAGDTVRLVLDEPDGASSTVLFASELP